MQQSPAVCQSPLESHEVAILDAFHVVFVWVGSLSTNYKRSMASSTASSYIERSILGHVSTLTPVIVEEGKETLLFKVRGCLCSVSTNCLLIY